MTHHEVSQVSYTYINAENAIPACSLSLSLSPPPPYPLILRTIGSCQALLVTYKQPG